MTCRYSSLSSSSMWTALLIGVCAASVGRAEERPLRQLIDAAIKAGWQRDKVAGAPLADDATFLRRIYLDLVGTLPTYDETVRFLEVKEADKRGKLIERLLDDPRFGKQQAHVWEKVFFLKDAANAEAAKNREVFRKWLADKVNKNEPYDRWVKELLLGEGNTQENGPPLFYVQFMGNSQETAVAVSRIFLGTQLQCAQCHDHPYEKWKQLDFYGLAGFFARLVVLQPAGEGKGRYVIAEKRTGEVLFTGPANQQKPGQKGTPVPARYLGGDVLEEPPVPKDFKEPELKGAKAPPPPDFSRKEKLVEWVVAKDNRYFARAAANRIWAQFMGRGLIHPVDDLREGKTPSHPELSQALCQQFVARDFDMKWLIRELVNSQTYQLGAAKELADPATFAQSWLRPLSAEEMLASLCVATGCDKDKLPSGLMDYGMRHFGDATDGRGEFQASLNERLFMNNGAHIRQLIQRRPGNLADTLATSKDSWEEKVERLYLSVLSRPPRPQEKQRFVEHLTSDPKKADALVEEAVWALLNCSEFRFNH